MIDDDFHAPFFDFGGNKGRMFQRLGAALAFRWDEVPVEVQKLLIEQAEFVGGLGPEADADDRTATAIERFVVDGMRKATVGK